MVTMTLPLGVPRLVSSTLGNLLIVLSALLCVIAVLWHTPHRLSMPWTWAGVAATTAALAAGNAAAWKPVVTNMVLPTILPVALFLYAAWAIANRGPKDAQGAGRFLGAVLVFAVITWTARVLAMLAALDAQGAINERIDLVVSVFAIAQMVNGVAATLCLVWIDVRLMQAELARAAHTDALTELPNRRAVRSRFDEECARAARRGERFALALFDVDHFKQVNDRHGHAAGDKVLRAVGAALDQGKRSEDVLGRIGGEEFLVLLAQPSASGAREAADRLRLAASAAQVGADAGPVRVTVSAGVAMYPDDGRDWDHLFAAADRRLYAAKNAGRDRVEAAG
jgi:diguanylate cyclase (GGDEF)-like protein